MRTELSQPVNGSNLCATCNQRDGVVYRMRLHNRDGTHTDIELAVCKRCFDSYHSLEWIEISDKV
jgi:hypothetical protein